MKRTREHTSDAPNAKRTKTEQVFEALNNLAQNLIVPLKNLIWGSDAHNLVSEDTVADEGIPLIEDVPVLADIQPVQPNNPPIIATLEEAPQLVDGKANTIDEIDPDLKDAIAFSLIADVDADEESNKVVPYGCHENVQNIIMDFRLLWEQNFLKLEIPSKYDSNSDEGVFHRTQLENYRSEITADFDKLNVAVNETVFQRTLFKMASHMLLMHHICHYKSGHQYLLPKKCEKIDSLFNKHNLTQTMVALMLEKHSDICEKLTNVWNFMVLGHDDNKLINEKSFNATYNVVVSSSAVEKLMSLISPKGEVFKHGFNYSTSHDYEYKKKINKAKDSLITHDRNLFFMANQACFQSKLPEAASVILPTINSFCCVLKFSEENVTKLQDSFRKIHEDRDSAQKPRLMSNK